MTKSTVSSEFSGAIVVGLDGSGHSERALEWAAAEARLQHRKVVLLHSAAAIQTRQALGLGPFGPGVDAHLLVQSVQDAAQAFVDDALVRTRARWPDLDAHASLSQLDPREALVDASRMATMIVLGSRGRGVFTSLLGSVSVYTSKHAHCPVVVCRPSSPKAERRGVLVGADGTPANTPALEMAFRLAAERSGDLTVMHCAYEVGDVSSGLEDWEDEGQRMLAESIAGLREKYPNVTARLRVRIGLVDVTLADASDGFDLLVLGRPSPTDAHLFHSSTAVSTLERSTTTVVMVPGPRQELSDERRRTSGDATEHHTRR